MEQMTSKRQGLTRIGRGAARPAILEAAAELFATRGYAATSILDIARAAGVGRPTVFTAVGTKPELFLAVLEAAITADHPGVPILEQQWLRDLLKEPDPRQMLAANAHGVRLIGERVSDLYWAAECASQYDVIVKTVFDSVEADRRQVGRWLAAELVSRGALQVGYDESSAADVINTLMSPASWRALVSDAGWSPDRWEHWIASACCVLLLR